MAYPSITNYNWNMGDGNTYNGAGYATVEHEYNSPGTYLVTLTITNSDADTATATMLYNVGGYLSITNYDWDFGDSETSTTQNPAHTFDNPGSYVVELQLTDEDANTVTSTMIYNVGYDYVPDYSWDFDDGNTDTGASVSNTFNAGYFDVELTATDDFGQEATDTVRVASILVKSCPINLYYYTNGYTASGDYAFTNGTLTDFLHNSYGLRIRKVSGQSGTENRYASTKKSINHHSENDFWMGFTIGEFNAASATSTTTRHQIYFYLDDVTNSPIYDYGFCVYVEYANTRFRLQRVKDGTQGPWHSYSAGTYYDILLKKTDSTLQYYVDGVEDATLSHSYEGDGNLKSEPYDVSMWVYTICHTDDKYRAPYVYVRNLYLVASNNIGTPCSGVGINNRLMMIF